jgi:hypothetical protein
MAVEGVKINPKVFAKALDDLVSDPGLRSRLEATPIETLPQLGIEVDDRLRAELTGRRLSDLIPRQQPGSVGGIGQVAETYVHVGVDVAVSVVVSVVVGAEVEQLREEIAQVNVQKIQQLKRGQLARPQGGG